MVHKLTAFDRDNILARATLPALTGEEVGAVNARISALNGLTFQSTSACYQVISVEPVDSARDCCLLFHGEMQGLSWVLGFQAFPAMAQLEEAFIPWHLSEIPDEIRDFGIKLLWQDFMGQEVVLTSMEVDHAFKPKDFDQALILRCQKSKGESAFNLYVGVPENFPFEALQNLPKILQQSRELPAELRIRIPLYCGRGGLQLDEFENLQVGDIILMSEAG